MKRSLSLLVVFTLLLSLSMVFVYGEPVADVDKVETAVEEVIVEESVDTESVVEGKEVVKEDGEKKADEKAEEATEDAVAEEKKEEVADEKVVATDGAKVEIAEEVTEDEAVVDEEVVEEEEERGVMSHDPMPAEDTPITEAPKVEFVHPSDLPADEALAMYNNFTISEKLTVYPILKVSVVLDYIFFFVFLAYCLFYILHLLYVLVKGKGLRKNLSLRGFLLFVVCAIFLVLQMNNMYVTMITEILIKSRLIG
jgi:hypothetical protein